MGRGKKKDKIKLVRIIPLILMLGIFIFVATSYRDISIDDILNYTPSNYYLAAGLIILMFGVKSVSMAIPLSVLYISSGIIFPGFWAILINILGLILCMTIPYFIGRYSGTALFNKLAAKYPKVDKIKQIDEGNKWFLVFIVKILGFIPNEISSLTLGTMEIPYGIYIVAAVLGKTPSMIATTILGSNFNKPGTSGFIWSIIISIVIFLGIGFFYKKNRDRFKL